MDEYLKHITPLFTPSSGCDAHRIVIPLTGLGMVIYYRHLQNAKKKRQISGPRFEKGKPVKPENN